MARLQMLYLPGVERNGVRVQPFALIVDEHAPPPMMMIRIPEPVIPGIDPPPSDPASDDRLWAVPDGQLLALPEVDEFTAAWRQFAADIGAAGALVTHERVDLVEADDDDRLTVEFDSTELAKSIAHAMRGHLETAAGTATREWLDRHAEGLAAGRPE